VKYLIGWGMAVIEKHLIKTGFNYFHDYYMVYQEEIT
jgi:hypothetical protein